MAHRGARGCAAPTRAEALSGLLRGQRFRREPIVGKQESMRNGMNEAYFLLVLQ